MSTTIRYLASDAHLDRSGGETLRPDQERIFSLVPQGARVLDLGCGDGALLARLAAEKGVIARGIELSDAGLRLCIGRGLSVRHGDLDEGLADYPNDSFDVVVLCNTLPYLDQPRRVLQEMLRVGHTGIVSFANMGHIRNRIAVALGREVRGCELADAPRARPISLQSFRALCASLGLRVLREAHSGRLWPTLLADTGIFVVGRGG